MNIKKLGISVLLVFSLVNISSAAEYSHSTTYSNATQTSKIYSKENKQSIELSILSEEDSQDLFKLLKNRDDLPYDYIMDGQYARTHKMNRILDEQGIISGKVFIEGEFYLKIKNQKIVNNFKSSDKHYEAVGYTGVSYLVVPIVLVNKNNILTTYVFDPAFFDEAVPYEAWKNKMLSHSNSKLEHEYFTTRFCAGIEDVSKEFKDYLEDDLLDMNQTNRAIARALFMINHNK